MRAVVQRVDRAAVRVDAEEVADMGPGLLALVGVETGDGATDVATLLDKLLHLRIFEDERGRMNRSLVDTAGALGVVSQFTLLGDARKGRRPSFARAAPPDEARARLEELVEAARRAGVTVVTGRFGAHMDVELVNRGPVTIVLDTRRVRETG